MGIKNIQYPFRIRKKSNDYQHTIADIELSVKLPADSRGTHMSRFISVIEEVKDNFDGKAAKEILKNIVRVLECKTAYVKITFPYFLTKRAPESRESSIAKTICGYQSIIKEGSIDTSLIVEVNVTTCCPCSKEISKYGAHNQRATVRMIVGESGFIWFEDLIDIIEQCGSAPIYPLLKREDEKFVTEQAYDNPKFVEDLVREIYNKTLKKYKDRISRIRIEVESDESIHQHKAFAVIDKTVTGKEL